jgi:hypothetical protein
MATVFRRKLTRWILDGKRVDKGTPGAKRHTTKSREWYGLVRGEYVKLSPLRDIAEQKLRQKLREIEESRVNQFAVHRRSALADHIAKFHEHLEATCRSARYVRETIQRLNVVAAKCTLLEHITSDHVDTA